MSAGANRILRAMDKVGRETSARTASDLTFGTVKEIEPLKIVRDGENSNGYLSANQLFLCMSCRPIKIETASHTHTVTIGEESYVTDAKPEEVVLWEGLKVGDKVLLASFDRGQKYLVERVSDK